MGVNCLVRKVDQTYSTVRRPAGTLWLGDLSQRGRLVEAENNAERCYMSFSKD